MENLCRQYNYIYHICQVKKKKRLPSENMEASILNDFCVNLVSLLIIQNKSFR